MYTPIDATPPPPNIPPKQGKRLQNYNSIRHPPHAWHGFYRSFCPLLYRALAKRRATQTAPDGTTQTATQHNTTLHYTTLANSYLNRQTCICMAVVSDQLSKRETRLMTASDLIFLVSSHLISSIAPTPITNAAQHGHNISTSRGRGLGHYYHPCIPVSSAPRPPAG